MIKFFMYSLLTLILLGCGPKIVTIEEPTSISNTQIEATENCDIERE